MNAIDQAATLAAQPQVQARTRYHIPGEVAIWVFILGDMLMFTAFFGQFYHDRAAQVAVFDSSQATLSVTFGALNTLVLLTGSLFVVLGLERFKAGLAQAASRFFALAFLCALGFSFNKVLEYGGKLSLGLTPTTNDFYMYYYVFTGIHMLHLLIGMVFLWNMWCIARTGARDPRRLRFIEVGASYWHLVDLLWVVLFPILYIVY